MSAATGWPTGSGERLSALRGPDCLDVGCDRLAAGSGKRLSALRGPDCLDVGCDRLAAEAASV